MQLRPLLALATAALLAAACGNADTAPAGDAAATSTAVDVALPEVDVRPTTIEGAPDAQIGAFAAANGLDEVQTTASGLAYVIREPGGEAHPSVADEITIHYHGYLPSGKTFDRTKGTPRTFPLSQLIPAWQEAIPMIGRGGVITILAPPSTAYGARPPAGSGITDESVLVFDIALVDF